MSDRHASEKLAAVVEEAKRDMVPPPRAWDEIEARVMEEVRRDQASLVAEASSGASGRRWQLATGALALAAAVALFVRHGRDVAFEPTLASPASIPAGAMRATDGEAEGVRVAGVVAEPGHALRVGDVVTAHKARALFERPGRVAWMLDGASSGSVHVTQASETLVLRLDEGAVEAQVTPVPSGEAFAVDVNVEGHVVRVAVHGTHLRVSRADTRVIVDLSEGVISVGRPPRTGSTFGAVISAPAHVELDARDLATLRVDRAPGAVRAPVDLAAPFEQPSRLAEVEPLSPPNGLVDPQAPPSATAPASPTAPSAPSVQPPAVPPAPRVTEAVKACAAAQARRSDVKVTLTTSVRLRVRADGSVESARFDPPLMPALQQCAAEAIYKSRLAAEGDVQVSVEYTY